VARSRSVAALQICRLEFVLETFMHSLTVGGGYLKVEEVKGGAL
jgi:hypothetical protein